MRKNEFDLIVIGARSGGLGAALGMLTLGFKVLLVDKKAENFGGECVHTGCIPSKALLYVAGQIHQGRSAGRFGPKLQGEVDFEKVKNYIKVKQNSILAHENPDYLREQGMHFALGTASFVSKNEIKVQDNTYEARNIVIATGSSPLTMKIEGAQDFPVLTNETVFDVEYIPQNFVFIGAGPVSIELGQAFSRLAPGI
jgi:pyruvate/2-oxoglutarate dehydrogenase complex dihydrolipoamide dehydrogenase (E3) component